MNSVKSELDILMSSNFNCDTRLMDDSVNRFFDDSSENPPDSVAPLNEHRFIMKYLHACVNIFSQQCT